MSLKHGLLGLLHYGEMTGYELNGVFEASLSYFWRAQKSQIYRELKTMEGAGWVESRLVIQTDKPNKRLYAITPAGVAELMAWLGQPLHNHEEQAHNPLLLQLFFIGALPREENLQNIGALHEQALQIVDILSEAPESAIQLYGGVVGNPSDPAYWRFTVDYGRRYYQMLADWSKAMIDTLAAEPPEGEAEEGK